MHNLSTPMSNDAAGAARIPPLALSLSAGFAAQLCLRSSGAGPTDRAGHRPTFLRVCCPYCNRMMQPDLSANHGVVSVRRGYFRSCSSCGSMIS